MAENQEIEAMGEPRPKRRDAQQSRAALMQAARELFAERGPEALTVVAVAKRAGLNRSTAYQHFRTREELIAAVGRAFEEEVRGIYRQPRGVGERMDFFVDYFCEHPSLARLWMFQLLTNKGEIGAGWEDYLAAMEMLAQSPRSQDGIDAEMLGLIGMTSALVWSLIAQKRMDNGEDASADTERFARELKRLFLFGALRPEAWPEVRAEFEADDSSETTEKRSEPS
jgi:AcrR family transcriptional regulator